MPISEFAKKRNEVLFHSTKKGSLTFAVVMLQKTMKYFGLVSIKRYVISHRLLPNYEKRPFLGCHYTDIRQIYDCTLPLGNGKIERRIDLLHFP